MAPTVLLTRTRGELLGSRLEARGLRVVHRPLVERRWTGAPPPDARPEVVVITSAFTAGLPGLARQVEGAEIRAVGRATARALEAAGIRPQLVGEGGGAELLATGSGLLWFVGALQPAAPTRAALASWPGRALHWAVYETLPAAPLRVEEVHGVDVVEVSSPSAARALARSGHTLPPLGCIGSTTAAAARELGLTVAGVAADPGLEGMVRLLEGLAQSG